MHSAPAVSYPVGRSYLRAAVRLAPWLLAALIATLWAGQASKPYAPPVLSALFMASAGLLLTWRGESRAPAGWLRWDGQHWHWESSGAVRIGTVSSRADWQSGLLLEFAGEQERPVWIWLTRQSAPLSWHALRCAVYARPVRQTGDASHPTAGAAS